MGIKEIVKRALTENGVFIFGDKDFYTSSSGFELPFFIDPRRICAEPKNLKKIAKYFSAILKRKNIGAVAGCETGGIALAEAVSLEAGLPFFYVRKEPQDHGMFSVIGGRPPKDKSTKVAIFDDSIGAGGSMKKFVGNLIKEGYNPILFLAVTEMNLFSEAEKRVEDMKKIGIEDIYLVTCNEWIEYLYNNKLLSKEFKEIVLSFLHNPRYFSEGNNLKDYKEKLKNGSIWYKGP